jgi:hypothetical protein
MTTTVHGTKNFSVHGTGTLNVFFRQALRRHRKLRCHAPEEQNHRPGARPLPPAFGSKSKRYRGSRPVTTGNFSIHHRTARAVPLEVSGIERAPFSSVPSHV